MIKKAAEALKQIGHSFSIEPFGSLMGPIIDKVLREHNKDKTRKGTILRPRILIWLVLAITLRRDLNYHKTLDWIFSGVRWVKLNIPKVIVKTGTISHARVKLGIGVFRDIFYNLASAFSDIVPDFHGFATVMSDGSSLTMPDTESNKKKFGKHKSGRGKGAFP
ncbi:transposase domain-containing protein [Desulfococcaceae bacterium HSG7]|nr:transposase domain-containing protein [Desulfococcaceae bacterium HSG7]